MKIYNVIELIVSEQDGLCDTIVLPFATRELAQKYVSSLLELEKTEHPEEFTDKVAYEYNSDENGFEVYLKNRYFEFNYSVRISETELAENEDADYYINIQHFS